MIGLEAFLYRICCDSKLRSSDHLKSFLTLKAYEFTALRKSDSKLFQKISENLKNAAVSLPEEIPTRWETEQRFADRMGDRMTRIERITERLQTELGNYQSKLKIYICI